MARFWKHKSEKPLVWNYYGWYYSIEYYGITQTFIDIEKLRELGNEIAEGKPRRIYFPHPIWSKRGFAMRKHFLRERYIHFRYQKGIANLFDQAYKRFSSEQDNEEVASQNESGCDWRQS